MDESGDAGVGPNTRTPTFTIACVLLPANDWPRLFDELLAFRRYLKDSFGLRMRDEVKGRELSLGNGPWTRLGLGDRVRNRIYRSFMRLEAKLATVRTYAVVIDKQGLASPDEVRRTAWTYAFNRLERFCHYSGEQLLLFPDSGDIVRQTRLTREMRRFAYVPPAFGGAAMPRPFVQLIEDPAAKASHESYFVQLADLNAYAAYRRLRPVAGFNQNTWEELGSAIHTEANRLKVRYGAVPGIVTN